MNFSEMDNQSIEKFLLKCKEYQLDVKFAFEFGDLYLGTIQELVYQDNKPETVKLDRYGMVKKIFPKWYKNTKLMGTSIVSLSFAYLKQCKNVEIITAGELGDCLCTEGNSLCNRMERANKKEAKQLGYRAFCLYRLSALLGDPMGMNNLGCCYYWGKGIRKNNKRAVKWYRKALKHGNGLGAYNLGYMYYDGYGVKKSLKRAVKCWKKGAKLKDILCEREMGVCYKNGEYVKQSDKKACKLWEHAAGEGDGLAQNYYARALYYGEGTKKHKKRAIAMMQIALDNGISGSKKWLKKWNAWQGKEKVK